MFNIENIENDTNGIVDITDDFFPQGDDTDELMDIDDFFCLDSIDIESYLDPIVSYTESEAADPIISYTDSEAADPIVTYADNEAYQNGNYADNAADQIISSVDNNNCIFFDDVTDNFPTTAYLDQIDFDSPYSNLPISFHRDYKKFSAPLITECEIDSDNGSFSFESAAELEKERRNFEIVNNLIEVLSHSESSQIKVKKEEEFNFKNIANEHNYPNKTQMLLFEFDDIVENLDVDNIKTENDSNLDIIFEDIFSMEEIA